MEQKFIQKIIFGSPGTGKSHMITSEIIPNELNIDSEENVIKAVFHPEYTYGDFMGKLLPMTKAGNVEYNFYEAHFLRALAQSYRNLFKAYDKEKKEITNYENVILVIDEINRGNSSAIFGSVFQLLDRETNGWSSYETTINGVVFFKLFELIGFEVASTTNHGEMATIKHPILTANRPRTVDDLNEVMKDIFKFDLVNKTIKIPPNLSIVATMNTSDSSIYHMDTAFKRRWDWEFIDIESKSIKDEQIAFSNRQEWENFVTKLNLFIKSNHGAVRGIEDKQIGKYFIKDETISNSVIQSKLMFFIWDSVFNRDKKPLLKLLDLEDQPNQLITFGDFAIKVKDFVQAIKGYQVNV